MAGSVNKVIVLGNLGANPELKYLPSGQPVCEMRVATTESFRDRNEQLQERTEWHRIVVWGKTGENCAKYLTKGRQVYVEGRLQTRSWDDKEGKKQYTTEVVANQVVFLGGGARGDDAAARSNQSGNYSSEAAGYANAGGGYANPGGGYGSGGGSKGYSRPPEPPAAPSNDSGEFASDDDIPF